MASQTYTVQIDSNYRDINNYPLSTDFAVRFNTIQQTGPSVNGLPTDSTFNLQTQIDPDFVSSTFRVVNGSLQHIQRDIDGNFYISGTMDILGTDEQFQILQGNYRIYTTSTNSIPNVFIGKFAPLGDSFYLSWLCYLEPTSSPLDTTSYRLSPTRSTLEIDISGNIYWSFDCSFNSANAVSTLNPNSPLYTIKPDNQNDRQYNVICAFSPDGSQYTVNGQQWGYHILATNNDVLPTLQNGRNYIKSNTALDLFTTINTNPYDPYVYTHTGTYGDVSNSIYFFYLNPSAANYDTNLRALYFRYTPGTSTASFDYYKVTSSGFDYITTLDPGLPASISAGYWTVHWAKNSTKVWVSCVDRSAYPTTSMISFDLITESLVYEFYQNLGYSPATPSVPVSSNSEQPIAFNATGSDLYIVLDNNFYGDQIGTILYKLPASSPTSFVLINQDNTLKGYYGQSLDIFTYNDYIVSSVTDFSDPRVGIKVYNTVTTAYSSTGYRQIGNFNTTYSQYGFTRLFKDLNGNLCCFATYIYGGVIFKIDPITLVATYKCSINDFGENKPYVFNSGGKLYAINSSFGRIYDISNIEYPYKLAEQYPNPITDEYQTKIFQVISTTSGNILGGIFINRFKAATILTPVLFNTNFIDYPTTLTSKHYSKPEVSYIPWLESDGNRRKYWDIFTIPGSSTNISTNFSPIQYINNGLVAWYKCNNKNNLILSGTDIVKGIIDLSGNGLDLHTSNPTGSCPTFEDSSVFSNNSPCIQWINGQTASFTSSGAWTQSPIKFVIMSYNITNTGGFSYGDTNIIPFEASSGTNIYAQSNYTGVKMAYTEGLITTTTNLNYSITVGGINTPIYFGYNTPDTLQPFLASSYISTFIQGTNYHPITTSYNYINIMKNISGMSNYAIVLREIIVLDFIPTEYQLSLFQYYLNSQYDVFPKVIPPLSGVYTVYSESSYSNNNLLYSRVDGSSITDTEFGYYSLSSPDYYIDVKHLRAPYINNNIFISIASDYKVRVDTMNDYLQYISSSSYSTIYDLSSSSIPLYNIQAYVDTNGVAKFLVSVYSTNPYETSNVFYHFTILENSSGVPTLQLDNTFSIPDPYSPAGTLPYFITTYKVSLYDDGTSYLFVNVASNTIDTSEGGTLGCVIQIYDISDATNFNLVYQDPNPGVPGTYNFPSSNRYSSSITKYPDNKIYFIIKYIHGATTYVYDVTSPENSFQLPYLSTALQYYPSLPNPADRYTAYSQVPISVYRNPVTNKIYYVNSSNIIRTSSLYGQISMVDISNIQSIGTNLTIEQKFYAYNNDTSSFQLFNVSTGCISNIKTTIWNQKVWGMFLMNDISSGDVSGTAFINLSNAEYVSQSYTDNKFSSITQQQTYPNIKGIGVGIIHKINNIGYPNWVSNLGGNASGAVKWATNINISNIDVDNTLTFAYVAGSWQNNLQALVDADLNGNPITPYILNSITTIPVDTSVNSFICKLNINNGTFLWLTPTFGTNDDYFQRIMYNTSNATISVSSYFSSPVMLVYSPQTSATSGWSNPLNTVLNISNPSTITGAIFTLNSNGVLQWSTKLYSSEQNSQTKLYDLYIESGTITCLAETNAVNLRCIDSTNTNTQITYSNIDPLFQKAIVMYTFNNSGIYQKSQRTELPPGLQSNIYDIKTYSSLNRIIYFINCFASKWVGSIDIYNKDGSVADAIYEYPIGANFSQLFQYQFDSSFVDNNSKKYSKLVLSYYYTGPSLENYKIFIQGGLQDFIPDSVTSTYLNTDSYLNTNFSIRSNTGDSNGTTIILNSLVPTDKIVRNNLPYEGIRWLSSISETPLFGMFSYSSGTSLNTYNMTQLFSSNPTLVSSTGTYFVVYPITGGYRITDVSSITNFRGLYKITTTSPISNNTILPYAYLTTYNNSVNYTLQFYPGSIAISTYFNITLNTLTIPDRPIKNSIYPGIRYLSDYPYIYLMVVNTNIYGDSDNQILNNFFTTNTNKDSSAIFTIPITSGGGSSNYITLSSSLSARIKFTPGYYNIRTAIFDPDGNVIVFDNTPVKAIDSIFTGGVVPDKLLNLVAVVTFKMA
jgi:hypothetical protein